MMMTTSVDAARGFSPSKAILASPSKVDAARGFSGLPNTVEKAASPEKPSKIVVPLYPRLALSPLSPNAMRLRGTSRGSKSLTTPKASPRAARAPEATPVAASPAAGGLEDDLDLDIVLAAETPPRFRDLQRSPASARAAMAAYRRMQNAEDRLVEVAGVGGLRFHRKRSEDDPRDPRKLVDADGVRACWGPSGDVECVEQELFQDAPSCVAMDTYCTVS